MKNNDEGMVPDPYPQLSFFTTYMVSVAPKVDRHSMEHPMFIISKQGLNKECIEYEHNGTKIKITPSGIGYATIWDKDILNYAVTKLVDDLNKGSQISRTVRIVARDLLLNTYRSTGGQDYEDLMKAFTRLRGTVITTNIETNKQRRGRGFGLIDEWEIIEKDKNGKMIAINVTLSKWLFSAVTGLEVLTINREYFRLKSGLERRVYELARKHCGHQEFWTIGLDTLYKKSGSQGTLKEFTRMIKEAVQRNQVPDYDIQYDVDRKMLYVSQKGGGRNPEPKRKKGGGRNPESHPGLFVPNNTDNTEVEGEEG